MRPGLALLSSLVLCYSSSFIQPAAASTSVTIDDTYGDSTTGVLPIYSLDWNVGQDCPACAIIPDASQAFMGSWHDTTSNNPVDSVPHRVTLTFKGTAIWVYCILANFEKPGITTYTNASFELDGNPEGTYSHDPDGPTDDFKYNVTVYSKTGLNDAEHTLVMTAGQGTNASLLLFDWALYMSEDGTSVTSADHSGTSSSTPLSSLPLPSSSTTTSSLAALATDSGATENADSTWVQISQSTTSTPSATKSSAAARRLSRSTLGSATFLLSAWTLM